VSKKKKKVIIEKQKNGKRIEEGCSFFKADIVKGQHAVSWNLME